MNHERRPAEKRCFVCGRTFPKKDLVAGGVIRPAIAEEIRREHEGWSPDAFICRTDLAVFRAKYVQSLLVSEKGELTSLEQDVIDSLREHELLTRNLDSESALAWSFGERLADKIASFGGSWTFLILFAGFLLIWIVMNSLVLYWRPVDPYPFILLNLVLSCLASIQAPIIMMSQNRQEAKDRAQSKHDYQVNLKAELEIRQLHEKIDHLLSHQWERMVEIQQVQMELLAELGKD